MASHPSMQSCPSRLRPRLVRRFYHDVDMANCHPTLMVQVAAQMGLPATAVEVLREYVEQRPLMLDRIGEHYGVLAGRAKYAVLRVLNGGSIGAWERDAEVIRNRGEPQGDLRALESEAAEVQSAFFRKYQSEASALKAEIGEAARIAVTSAKRHLELAAPGQREEAGRRFNSAKLKASARAIDRSVFSLCIFELEDTILTVIDEYLQNRGVVVSSLQFDGLHVEHIAGDEYEPGLGWRRLEEAMRGAEDGANWATRSGSWRSRCFPGASRRMRRRG
jgi:hypothetical protein